MVTRWLQDGLNALHLAATGNHVEVVRTLVGEFGLSVTQRDIVSCTLVDVCSDSMEMCAQYCSRSNYVDMF